MTFEERFEKIGKPKEARVSKVRVYYIGTECGRILTENPGGDYWKAVVEKHHADQLAEALERITNYPKYYASSLSNGFLDSSKTMEGQFEIVKNIAKQALKNYQEGE